MDNIMRIVQASMCTGCGACNICDNIRLETNALAGDQCTSCDKCVKACVFDPLREDD